MKIQELKSLIRSEVRKSLNEELDHTYEGIEDSILQGLSDWTEIPKPKLWNSMTPNAKRALGVLIRELKLTLDTK
jgi:hypothetical protein